MKCTSTPFLFKPIQGIFVDSKDFAKKLSNLVMLMPPIAYGALLWQSPGFAELLAASFIFFAFIPHYLIEAFQKLPRTPANKTRAIGEFVLSFAAGFALLWALDAPAAVLAFSASLVANHLLAYFITPYWMISTHAMLSVPALVVFAMQGSIGAWPALLIYLIFGWARIHLKAHTPMQYLAGGAVGVLLTWVALAAVGV